MALGGGSGLRVLVGDDLGLLRDLRAPSVLEAGAAAAAGRHGAPDRGRGVRALACRGGAPGDAVVAVGRRDGSLEVRPAAGAEGSLGETLSSAQFGGEGSVGSVWWAGGGASGAGAAARPILMAATEGGVVRAWDAGGAPGDVLQRAPHVELATGGPVEGAACSACGGFVGVGGRANDLAVWDLERGEPVFRARPPKPGRLGLSDRPWVSALAWLPSAGSPLCLVAGTGHHELRLYDARQSRRPSLRATFGEARVTQVLAEGGGRPGVWAADGRGKVGFWDLRKGAEGVEGAARGANGSVRALARHPEMPLLLTAGLDRHLRFNSTTSARIELGRIYLKQFLNAVCFLPWVGMPEGWKPAEDGAAGDGDPSSGEPPLEPLGDAGEGAREDWEAGGSSGEEEEDWELADDDSGGYSAGDANEGSDHEDSYSGSLDSSQSTSELSEDPADSRKRRNESLALDRRDKRRR